MKSADFQDLETRGFVLVPSFLSEAELQLCRDDFAAQPVNTGNRNAPLSMASGKAHEAIEKRVREVLELVTAGTSLCVNLPLGAVYFATARFATATGVQPTWHQDHESFFAIQNHYDYLNFYIPINKPLKDKSNLSIIPFDALEKESPQTFRRVVRGGAARFLPMGDRTMVFLDDTGSVHLMHKDLNQLAHTPHLNAGDLLLLRGDIIHRTQDTETDRVSLSFRAGNSETPVRRSRLADGGPMKAWMMMNDARSYERLFRAFDTTGKKAACYAELQQTLNGLPDSESMGRKRFLRYLLRQKRRERVLLRFFGTSFTTVLGTLTVLRSQRRRRHATADGPAPAV